MTSIRTAEAFSTYGGLDSTSVNQAAPYSSHVLRTLAKGVNRLTTRAHPLFNMVWLEREATEYRASTFDGYVPNAWEALLPPITIMKKPGLSTCALRVRAKIATGNTMKIRVITSATGDESVRESDSGNIMTVTANGSYAYNDLTGIPISDGEFDTVSLLISGENPSSLAATATYGSPNTALADYIGTNTLIDDSATWNLTGNTLAGKAFLRFVDASSNRITTDREITEVQARVGEATGNILRFEPPLSRFERAAAVYYADTNGTAATGAYEVHSAPKFNITQIAMICEGRTL